MRVLGLLGGMSWQSSIEYEREINQIARKALGGTNSADLIIRSFNFAEIEQLQASGNWSEAGELLAKAANDLERLGAEAIVLCTNTMHVLAEQIEAAISVPFIHIADATGVEIQRQGLKKVLLLGTKYTMEKAFYKDRLVENFNLEVLTPSQDQRDEIHRIIYQELVQGQINSKSKDFYLQVIDQYSKLGVEGVIAGCTEIELLVTPDDVDMPYFPTTSLHSKAAAAFALSAD